MCSFISSIFLFAFKYIWIFLPLFSRVGFLLNVFEHVWAYLNMFKRIWACSIVFVYVSLFSFVFDCVWMCLNAYDWRSLSLTFLGGIRLYWTALDFITSHIVFHYSLLISLERLWTFQIILEFSPLFIIFSVPIVILLVGSFRLWFGSSFLTFCSNLLRHIV